MKTKLTILFLGLTILILSQSGCIIPATGGTETGTAKPGSGGGSADTITIQGTFAGGTQAALTADQVSKALFFSTDGSYVSADVTGETFSMDLDKGTPGGLIFVGSDNQFLGYLTLGNGIDSLPLNLVGDDVTSIDLGILSSASDVVEPAHNPLGSEFPLSDADQEAIAQANGFFASLVKNPDLDRDGLPDFLGGKFYRMMVLYFINAGSFGAAMTPTISSSDSINSYKLALDATDSDRPDTVSFTGPNGSGLAGSVSDQQNVYSGRTTYFSPLVESPDVPLAGPYTVAYKTTSFDFEVPDQSSAPTRVILPVPTVTLNGDGTINKVDWVYRIASASDQTLNPLAVVSGIEVQVDGAGAPCANYPQSGRIYNSGSIAPSTTQHLLTCQNLLWDDVSSIYMAYDDVYGNHNVVTWRN
jgi:hypothetical protein